MGGCFNNRFADSSHFFQIEFNVVETRFYLYRQRFDALLNLLVVDLILAKLSYSSLDSSRYNPFELLNRLRHAESYHRTKRQL